jgi:hypothetical protein
MTQAEIERQLVALQQKQTELENTLEQLRRNPATSDYESWWNGLDAGWRVLFVQNIRQPRTWDNAWQWARDWDLRAFQLTPKFYEKATQLRLFGCALQYHYPKIKTLQPLAIAVDLEALHCGKSDVDDLAPLSHLTKLRYLDINGTYIDDLTPLAGCRNLEYLNYQHQFAQHKDDLSVFPNLKSLNLRYGAIADLTCLSSLTELEYLNIGYTHVASLKPLYGHTRLTKIYMPKTDVPAHEIEEFKQLHPHCDMGFEPGEAGWQGK